VEFVPTLLFPDVFNNNSEIEEQPLTGLKSKRTEKVFHFRTNSIGGSNGRS